VNDERETLLVVTTLVVWRRAS